jgi:hypothetical protein
MSVICDYFRAADAEYAVLAIASGPLNGGFDTVEAKGLDPTVMLGQLIAFIRGTPWSPDTVRVSLVWPPPKTKPASQDTYDRPPESSPWREGPCLQELDVETRNALALVDDVRLLELAARWATIEEFRGPQSGISLLPLLKELVGLARRAQKNSEPLYCWSGL